MNIMSVFEDAAKVAALDAPISWASYPALQERTDDWNQRAGVKSWSIGTIKGNGMLPFSPELVPLARNRLVCDRGEATRNFVLAQHLYRFLRFTEHLELEAVIPACTRFRLGETPFAIPYTLARKAGRVLIDEAWHTECAGDLLDSMQASTGIAVCRSRTPAFLHVLRIMKASLTPEQQLLADLVFACVSETLITGTLTRVPRDEMVLPQVRDVLGEHAREEAFHHAIFADAMGVMWNQLSTPQRDTAGPLFGVFIAAFLRPDTLAELDGLEAAGFSAHEARRILEESRDADATEIHQQLWKAARPTVRCMEHHGLLEHAATRETLEMMDLLPTAGPGQAPLAS